MSRQAISTRVGTPLCATRRRLRLRVASAADTNHDHATRGGLSIGDEKSIGGEEGARGAVPRVDVSVPVWERTPNRTGVACILYLVYHNAMKNLRPIKATHLSESVYEALESAILQGELGPNSTVHDRQLAELLGVSRTPVRDALHRLECSGLVQRQPRGGWRVAGFDPQDVEEVFELRRALEPLGLKRLSRSWDEATVRELTTLFDEFPDQLPRDLYPEYLKRDHDFHSRLMECSENRRAIDFYTSLRHQIDRVRHYLSYGYEGRVDDSLSEHREICRAIDACDLEGATELLLYHLRQVETMFVKLAEEHQIERWLSARRA